MLAVQHTASLQSRSGMATPAVASHFAEIQTVEDIRAAIIYAEQHRLPLLVLGEGSNTVFVDDYSGLVVINQLRGITVVEETENTVTVDVAAGENWHEFVDYALNKGWFGLENLALIPGSVGAAPIQNIGAYGVEVAQNIQAVHCLHIATQWHETIKNTECKFAYRESIFKQELANQIVITAVRFRLNKTPEPILTYKPLKEFFAEQVPTPRGVFEKVCEIRMSKLPLPREVPNCGSFFKNPIVAENELRRLLSNWSNLVYFSDQNDSAAYKIAAGWLIEQRGWKNKSLNGVGLYKDHALVITNPNRREGFHIKEFANRIQIDIEQEFGLELEIEPNLI